MTLAVRASFPGAFLLVLVGGAANAAAAGPPAHIALVPGLATIEVGMEQVFTATLFDSTYQEVAVEADSQIGFAIDSSAVADVTTDANNPSLAHVTGVGVGMTTVRAFYVRGTAQTDIFTSSDLIVAPASTMGTGGAPGTGGAAGAGGGAAGSGGLSGTGGVAGTSGTAGVGGGAAECAATRCGASCSDLMTDPANCGGCGHTCVGTQICAAGLCQPSCSAGRVACSATCVDTQIDAANCGSCGRVCAVGDTCASGLCVAPQTCASATATVCSGSCVDPRTDVLNCGACGHACTAGRVCAEGVCTLTCASPTTLCSDTCADLSIEHANCGTCGNLCSTFDDCVKGLCKDSSQGACSYAPHQRGPALGRTILLTAIGGLLLMGRRRRQGPR